MLQLFRKSILPAMLQRVATVLATVLVAQGIQGELIDAITNGVVAFGLVAADFAIGYVKHKRAS